METDHTESANERPARASALEHVAWLLAVLGGVTLLMLWLVMEIPTKH